jgi:hypothetical protein
MQRFSQVKCLSIGLALCAGALLLAPACGTGSRPKVEGRCAAPPDVELKMIRDFETNDLVCDGSDSGAAPTWFASGDDTGLLQPPPRLPACVGGTIVDAGEAGVTCTPDPAAPRAPNVTESACVELIEDSACPTPEATHQRALVLRSQGHNDWGTLFGDYALNGSDNNFVEYHPARGAGYEGLAIIAKSPGNHDKAVTLQLDDMQTTRLTVPEGGFQFLDGAPVEGLEAGPNECTVAPVDPNTPATLDPATGNLISVGTVPPAGSCGNSFRRVLQVTDQWRLYLLPWSTFVQDRDPRASPTGIDPSQIRRILFRAEKQADLELWIDEIAFYRQKSVGSESAPDASQ